MTDEEIRKIAEKVAKDMMEEKPTTPEEKAARQGYEALRAEARRNMNRDA